MLNNRVDTVELIGIVDAVANEKSIDKELVLTSMEEAIEKAARTRYGQEIIFMFLSIELMDKSN